MEHKTLKPFKTSKDADSDYDLINFYLQPEFIKMISQQLAGQSTVNLAKVSEIKQAILNKSLVIDELALAEKIIAFESDLFKSP